MFACEIVLVIVLIFVCDGWVCKRCLCVIALVILLIYAWGVGVWMFVKTILVMIALLFWGSIGCVDRYSHEFLCVVYLFCSFHN